MSTQLSNRPSLYDLSFEWVQLRDELEANEGELTPELEARIDAVMAAGPERIEAAAMVCVQLEGSALVCEQEAMRLAARAKSYNDNAKRLKERMAMVLDVAFGGKIKTNRFTVYTQQAADHVAFSVADGHAIDEIEAAEPGLVRVTKELNKLALKDRFKAGEPLPLAVGFQVEPGKRSLRIR